jgi:hypothetical protein
MDRASGSGVFARDPLAERTYLLSRLAVLKREETDITHEFERPRCLYRERARLATHLQRVLAERRKIKDTMWDDKPVYDYLDSDKGTNLQNWLNMFIGAARKAQQNRERVEAANGD